MIYGKLWCVVKPSVGIPIFLSAVAVSSFLVHYMLVTHTTWVPAFLQGKAAAVAAAPAADTSATAPPAAAAPKKP